MPKLTIAVLKSSQYNRLNKKYPQIKLKDLRSSLGLAIPKIGKAYIRLTKDYDKNKDTIHHEIEELVNSNPSHGKNGVFFKKWYQYITDALPREIPSQIYQIAAGAIPVVGPAISAAIGTAYAKDAGGSNLQGALGALQGYSLGSIGAGVKSGITNWAQPGGTSFIKDFGAGFKSGLEKYAATSIVPGIKQTAPSYWLPPSTTTKVSTTTPSTTFMQGGPLSTYTTGGSVLGKSITPTTMGLSDLGTASNILYGGPAPYTGYTTGTGIGGGIPPLTTGQEVKKTILQQFKDALIGKGGLFTSPAGLIGTGMTAAGLLGSMTAKPPALTYRPEEYIKEAKEVAEKYNLTALPSYAQEEAIKMVQLPIEGAELEQQIDSEVVQSFQDIDREAERAIEQINRNYSQVGASGDTQRQSDISKVTQYAMQAKTAARANARATVLARAYTVKQNALNTVVSAGEYDARLALQLASLIGYQDELQNSIAMDDYEQFRNVLTTLLSTGSNAVFDILLNKERQKMLEELENVGKEGIIRMA